MKTRVNKYGFSLIELLVVIAVIALLMSVTLPGLIVAKERCRRVVCLSNIHQFILGLLVYTEHNDYRLPETGVESTFEIFLKNYDVLADSIGSEKSMYCPSLRGSFMKRNLAPHGTASAYEIESCGNDDNLREYVYIGYNYLGGHRNAPWPVIAPANSEWESARVSSCRITLPIITELNIWSKIYNKTVAPHGKRGPYRLGDDYMNTGLGGITSGQMGAVGGNIGHIDGSGHWQQIDEANIYRVSNNSQDIGWFSTW